MGDRTEERIPVAVLGATGMVGQRLVSLLDGHPWFRVAEVAASERSAGKRYSDAATWRLPTAIPDETAGLTVASVEDPLQSRLAFSGLGSDVALPLEERLAHEGVTVVSNASAHRMGADIPLLIPEINPSHLDCLDAQRMRWRNGGCIVTNPNCSVVGLVLALAPIHRTFGIRRASVVTMQAISGAGYPGVPSLAVADNVVPWISGEAVKVESEPQKILGTWEGSRFEPASFVVGAKVHRVAVSDGHLMSVSVATQTPATPGELRRCFEEFRGVPQELALPSAPLAPVHVRDEPDRPQPALDRDRERGMAVTVGGIEECPILGLRFEALVHNTIRGAAGAAILNAELLHARGLLQD